MQNEKEVKLHRHRPEVSGGDSTYACIARVFFVADGGGKSARTTQSTDATHRHGNQNVTQTINHVSQRRKNKHAFFFCIQMGQTNSHGGKNAPLNDDDNIAYLK